MEMPARVLAQANSTRCLLTFIVPTFNEEPTIGEVLSRVARLAFPKQVIVVDDGSTDGTGAAVRPWREHPDFEFVRHHRNRGKGAAVRSGLARARGDITLIQDGDLEYCPEEWGQIVEPLRCGGGDVVYGSRYLAAESRIASDWHVNRLGVSLINCLVRCLYGVRLTDEATCYKAFPTEVLAHMNLECEGFEFCSEVTAKACRMGLRIMEVPIHYAPRNRRQGKKIRWRDGIKAIWTLWKFRNWRPGIDAVFEGHRAFHGNG